LTRADTEALLIAARTSGLRMVKPYTQPPLHPRCRCRLDPLARADGTLSWRWITAQDERVCSECAPLDGQDVGAA